MEPQLPLVILGSARRQSDTERYVKYVFESLPYQLIDLLDHNISVYKYDSDYPEGDDFEELAKAFIAHNTIVFATPVYWYTMSASMKTVFDRITDLVTIQKKMGRQLKGKSVFVLAVGTDEDLPEGFEAPFRLTADYLNMHYKRAIYFSSKHLRAETENQSLRKAFIDEVIKSTLSDE